MKDFNIPQAVAMVLLASAIAATNVSAQAAPQGKPTLAEVQIRMMLMDFLKGVPSNDPKVFDTFFADDVVYTRGSGAVITKSDIMKSLQATPKGEDPNVTYDAEDVLIRQYGDTAILAFRLVQHTPGQPDKKYRNTGTFLKRSGKWQVVAWQATPVAPMEKKDSK